MSTPTEEAPAPAPTKRRHTTRIAAAATLTAALGVGLIACGQGSGDPAPDVKVDNAAAAPAAEPHAPLKKSRPTGLRIPAAGVDATSMLDLGVGADDALEVPPVDKADEPGWWTGGVTPGEKGAAVLVAHYDTAKGPALMKNVAKVRMGDEIEVPRADGSTATFKVREIEQVDKRTSPPIRCMGRPTGPSCAC
ncbi:sortase domain-bontaining protein [Streptomyces rectiviolaceus]|uniref:sortase domain-containing protein n=1 Tax=Streptomyces rectiviolaceus TaxID=332591 RepID=UPI00364501DF